MSALSPLDTILATRNARRHYDVTAASAIEERLQLSKLIAASYPLFEGVRDALMGRAKMISQARDYGLIRTMENLQIAAFEAGQWVAADAEARRYLSGGWLEEYVAAATSAAGADEVYCGQKLVWEAGGFEGESEVDVLARFGERLFFCSCKALKSHLDASDARTRTRLTAALHEADNLADHFAPTGSVVALAVTTDLLNEAQNSFRYRPLHGKAAALGVSLLSAESLAWPTLVSEIRSLFQ
jgi:hypothetical protein